MNRREFLKMLRDATVVAPALTVMGYSEPQPTVEQVCKPKPLYIAGGAVEWANAQWGYTLICGT